MVWATLGCDATENASRASGATNAPARADDSPDVVRISMDAKAKLDGGDFSRDGESRAAEAPRAWDHDTQAKTKRA